MGGGPLFLTKKQLKIIWTNCYWLHSCFTADGQILPEAEYKDPGNRALHNAYA